jgi:TonB family protein
MKQFAAIISILCLLWLAGQKSYAQKNTIVPSFKISGAKSYTDYQGKAKVEYHPESPNHLYIYDYNQEGQLLTKTSFLFKGEEFLLRKFNQYINEKQLVRDGKHYNYRNKNEVASELTYKEGIVVNALTYYENGNKEMYMEGDAATLNGEYKMWYPNGQLQFSGYYQNNIKHGDFESFSEDGKTLRKGTYEAGKLVSGVSVVQDLVYEKPDVPAEFPGGDDALNEYLNKRISNLKQFHDIREDEAIIIKLKLTINNCGDLKKLEYMGWYAQREHELVDYGFQDLSGFKPALIQDAPVSSILLKSLFLSKRGFRNYYRPEYVEIVNDSTTHTAENDTISKNTFFIVEEMPEFPGGREALRTHLAQTIRYPVYAQEHGIQGTVFVNYIVNEKGYVTNVKIFRGVHPTLDAEAIRVVENMPRWKPGRQKGQPVRVTYTMPIGFVLQ